MVRRICEVFGEISKLELVKDASGVFRGLVNVEFSNEIDAKRA